VNNLKPYPKCTKCGNEEKFEIEESDWAKHEDGNHMLVEKVKCASCGALLKAIYKLQSWESAE